MSDYRGEEYGNQGQATRQVDEFGDPIIRQTYDAHGNPVPHHQTGTGTGGDQYGHHQTGTGTTGHHQTLGEEFGRAPGADVTYPPGSGMVHGGGMTGMGTGAGISPGMTHGGGMTGSGTGTHDQPHGGVGGITGTGAHGEHYGSGAGAGTGGTTGILHRSGSSSSSSSSEDDGQGGRRKKGLKEKIKEKLPGGRKKEEGQYGTATGAHAPTTTTAGTGYGAGAAGQTHEKKGMMEKIKEKLPGHHPH